MNGETTRFTSSAVTFRAPGEANPPTEDVPEPGTAVAPGSPLFESPDLSNAPGVLSREKFLTRMAEEDADVRVLATALRLRGYPVRTIAIGLSVSQTRIRRVLKQARTDGNLNDTLQDLTTEALPLAIEGLIDHLHHKQEWAIKATLRGMGAFRTYSQQDGTVLRDERKLEVKFTLPPNTPMPTMNPRGIVGAPREVLDAAVQTVQVEEAATLGAHEDGEEGARRG
jgi:hypothetical protein